ncbi:transposase [Nitrosomonas aestuarii]|uniref:transposase n=1 Tax=Nitrosomonas aestuarii TaxID=52441 RepID=UPI00147FB8FB
MISITVVYQQIECCMPRQHGNVSHSDLQILNAILYVTEHGCKWRGLPKRFGKSHTESCSVRNTIFKRHNR